MHIYKLYSFWSINNTIQYKKFILDIQTFESVYSYRIMHSNFLIFIQQMNINHWCFKFLYTSLYLFCIIFTNSVFCFIQHGNEDHLLVKTIGQFVYLPVQVNLKCLWDNRDIESIKYRTIGI